MVSLVNLAFDLEAFLERVHRILEELLLVLVLLLDARVDVAVLRLLVLNKAKQALVHRNLQLLVIVRVLDYLVDSVLEVVDVCVVVADDVSVRRDSLRNQRLSYAQVLDHEAERGVD